MTAVGLAVYLLLTFFGMAGYVLCTETDGHMAVEAGGLLGCACPGTGLGHGQAVTASDCGPCVDQSLAGDSIRPADAGVDGPVPAVRALLRSDGPRRLHLEESLRPDAGRYAPHDISLSRSPVLLI